MKISEQDVRQVAELADLKLSDAEVSRLRAELDGILAHVDKLNEVDTSGVEPMAQVLVAQALACEDKVAQALACENTLRDDVPLPPLGNQAALANAPQPGAGYFKVPKVIER
jgi:aspartyl-tRNA(Asn)/glutamyl-tRNA(Gln) amidotransferase subunit C